MSTPEISRREVLAFIALQDLPIPGYVSMVDSMVDADPGEALVLKFFGPSAEADLNAWGDLLDASALYSYDDSPGEPGERRRNIWRGAIWRGRSVTLRAQMPIQLPSSPREPLDEETSSRLREIAGGTQ